MKTTELSVQNPILVLMVVCASIFIGITSLTKLKVDLFPDIKFPVLVVLTEYPGAAPSEIEENVVRPIEEAVAKVERVKRISSVSLEGVSYVIIEFNWGTNMDFASLDVRDNLDRIKGRLPKDAEDSIIQRQDFNSRPVVWLNLTGDYPLDQLKTVAEDEFKNQLERIEGVSSVEIMGGLTREIQIRVDPERLTAYRLSIQDISRAIKGENLNQRGGRLTEGKTDLLVRTVGRFITVDEINEVIVTHFQGVPVYLKDLAKVSDTFAERRSYSRLNKRPSVGLLIYKESDGNTVDVATKSIKRIAEIKKKLKKGITTSIVFDQSEYINNSINMVKEAAINGSIISVIVLFLFLADWRSTLIISLTIPISVVTTFGPIYFKGMTLNLLTLAGLALGIGMVVDNSIVVLENIFRHMSEGQSARHSSITGPKEVSLAVMASTLTTLAVFMPIAYVEGIAGEIFADLAFAVFFSLLVSLVVAFTVIPTLAARLLKRGKSSLDETRKKIYTGLAVIGLIIFFISAYFSVNIGITAYLIVVGLIFACFFFRKQIASFTLSGYHSIISAVVGKWYWKTALFLIIILLTIISVKIKPGMQFFPPGKEKSVQITMELPVGSSLENSDRIARDMEKIVTEYSEVESAAVNTEPETITVTLKFPEESEDDRIDEIVNELRTKTSQIPDTVSRIKKVGGMRGGRHGGGADLQINVHGDDLNVLKNLAEQILNRIKKIDGIISPDISYKEGRPELQVHIDKKKAGDQKLNTRTISDIIQASIAGGTATQFQEGDKEYDILVKLNENEVKSRDDIANLPLTGGLLVSDVAKLVWQRGPVKIERADQKRKVEVTANIQEGIPLGDIMALITTPEKTGAIDDIVVPDGYEIEFGGEGRDMTEAFGELFKALGIAIVLVYMIMAAKFGSLAQQFIIMFTVPLSIIGVFFGLKLAGLNVSITAMIGVIMLAGIVVNNAILLIDYVNISRGRGLGRKDAIVKAGEVRLRPIMMTTLTTILGMLPMALGIGAGVEFYQPLAVTVIGGLTFSTILSLIFIPALYDMFDEANIWLSRWARRIFIGEIVAGPAEEVSDPESAERTGQPGDILD